MKVIRGDQLPAIGWVGEPSAVLHPDRFEPPTIVNFDWIGGDGTKPGSGGLWCSPVLQHPLTRRPLGTAWSLRNKSAAYTPVEPLPEARIVCIDNADDLVEVIDRWPDRRPEPWPYSEVPLFGNRVRTPRRINWPVMATDVDAVFVTAPATPQLNLPFEQPHLWGWDVPTVLFLTPAFHPEVQPCQAS